MDRNKSSLAGVGVVSKSLIELEKLSGLPLKYQVLNGLGNPVY